MCFKILEYIFILRELRADALRGSQEPSLTVGPGFVSPRAAHLGHIPVTQDGKRNACVSQRVFHLYEIWYSELSSELREWENISERSRAGILLGSCKIISKGASYGDVRK